MHTVTKLTAETKTGSGPHLCKAFSYHNQNIVQASSLNLDAVCSAQRSLTCLWNRCFQLLYVLLLPLRGAK